MHQAQLDLLVLALQIVDKPVFSELHQHCLHKLELSDIALILDVPLGTVKSRLHRARQQMQQHLTA